ncbi:4-(cytidine 5'-diphospho)-2-C-methyl-D-erythritol kinase [candidate division WOR-3 bacterium]|nr:4-(cytidine 5'-diphospho)-2-C-methyl-D-erythritol kinase [candidate division WOR-3 bacterium]
MKINRFICPVKVNLSLQIIGKRDDGYHEIKTTFQSLDLGDRIVFRQSWGKDTLSVSGEKVPAGNNNLVLIALAAARRKHPEIPFFHVELYKKIPAGTGLGAGSSNAAVALLYAFENVDEKGKERTMEETALATGSDVPFFLKGGRARAEGRGDMLAFGEKTFGGRYVLIIPKERISTKTAYQSYDLTDEHEKYKRKTFQFRGEILCNDFESVVFKSYSKLEFYRNTLLEAGADFALMSGSGSAIYGFFSENKDAEKALLFLNKGIRENEVMIFSANPRERWNSVWDLSV